MTKKSNPILMSDHLVPSGDYYARQIGDELIVLNVNGVNGNYFGMNSTAATLWETIQENCPCVQELCDTMADRYQVDRSNLEKDLMDFIQLLVKKGLVSTKSMT